MRIRYCTLALTLALLSCTRAPQDPRADIERKSTPEQRTAALAAFPTIQKVLQHPRCQNCHIPGDAPLQFDAGLVHTMGVQRGADGAGGPGLPCATCHGEANSPASYGAHAPPGAPHWKLPPADQKMVFIGLDAAALCETIRNPASNGGKDLEAMHKHVAEDKLVLWGWAPGGERAPVDVPHADFTAKFRTWVDAGAPCPDPGASEST